MLGFVNMDIYDINLEQYSKEKDIEPDYTETNRIRHKKIIVEKPPFPWWIVIAGIIAGL